MTELAKCRRLAYWLQTLESLHIWVVVHRKVREVDVDAVRAHLKADELRKYEAMIGHNVLTLVGEWPIENTVWDLDEPKHVGTPLRALYDELGETPELDERTRAKVADEDDDGPPLPWRVNSDPVTGFDELVVTAPNGERLIHAEMMSRRSIFVSIGNHKVWAHVNDAGDVEIADIEDES